MGKSEKRIRTQSHPSQVLEPPTIPQTHITPVTPVLPTERRRASAKPQGSTLKKSRRKGQLSQLSTKDLGRWKPTDDLALILGVQQVNINIGIILIMYI